MKKVLSLILVLAALFATLLTPAQAAQPEEISPQYVNCQNACTYLTIDSSGEAIITIVLNGYTNITDVSVTTYLEQKIGSTWYRARVNPWTYTGNASSFTEKYTGHVSNSGTYRARSIFTITGSTAETFTVISEYTY